MDDHATQAPAVVTDCLTDLITTLSLGNQAHDSAAVLNDTNLYPHNIRQRTNSLYTTGTWHPIMSLCQAELKQLLIKYVNGLHDQTGANKA
jgi:hypothetical protein